jgi:predicted DNA-binding protein (UPF0278 family)
MPSRIIFILDNDKDPKTRRIIEKNLEKNVKMLMLYKSNYLNLKVYVFRPPEEYKDFNEYYVATGVDSIKIEDCEIWKPVTVNKLMNAIAWGGK